MNHNIVTIYLFQVLILNFNTEIYFSYFFINKETNSCKSPF